MQSVLAVVTTLLLLYVLGWLTSVVIGRQVFGLFESILERLPIVAKVYTSVRQLLDSMMAKKDTNQRVVLVDFPIPGQKSIGFLTRKYRGRAGGGFAAKCDQSDVGVSTIVADEQSDDHGSEHGTGDEHAADGWRCGAGEDRVLAAPGGDPGDVDRGAMNCPGNQGLGTRIVPLQDF